MIIMRLDSDLKPAVEGAHLSWIGDGLGRPSGICTSGARADGWSPPGAGYEAEGMACRVRVDVLTLGDPSAPDGDDLRVRTVGILDHHVDVELLRARWVRPCRGLVVGCQLEGESGGVVVLPNHDPVVGFVGDGQAEEFGIELGESARVWAVDHDVMAAPDHGPHPADCAVFRRPIDLRRDDDPDRRPKAPSPGVVGAYRPWILGYLV
jgi:hypothetical protein